jgi:hypothetical protein
VDRQLNPERNVDHHTDVRRHYCRDIDYLDFDQHNVDIDVKHRYVVNRHVNNDAIAH